MKRIYERANKQQWISLCIEHYHASYWSLFIYLYIYLILWNTWSCYGMKWFSLNTLLQLLCFDWTALNNLKAFSKDRILFFYNDRLFHVHTKQEPPQLKVRICSSSNDHMGLVSEVTVWKANFTGLKVHFYWVKCLYFVSLILSTN